MESILFFFHLTSLSSFSTMAKSVNLLVCFSVILGQDGLGESGCRIFKTNIFLERSVEIACFFEC